MASDWTCESIRLSLFSSEAVRLSTAHWTALTGQAEPELEQKGAGRQFFAGPMLGGQLNLGSIANRCDIILSPLAQAEVPEGYVPSVGQWPNALEGFQAHVEPFLEQLSFPVIRMGFAPVLVLLFKEIRDANKALISLVKSIQQLPEKARDVMFRINWPTNSKAMNGLVLNRITTWSVQQYQIQTFLTASPSPAAAFTNQLEHSLRLELDHNTDPKHAAAFDVGRLVPIYRELTNLALQNAAEGEVL